MARQMGAPDNAIFSYREAGTIQWRTTDDLDSRLRKELGVPD